MTYLIDTHVWLWSAFEPARLKDTVLEQLKHNPCRVSVASIWEVQIKVSLGKLPLPIPLAELVEQTAQKLAILSIERQHAIAVGSLPPHHRDPFDRMLVAQAITEGMQLVTADRSLGEYEVPILWAQA